MSRISSDTLFHFTPTLENLVSILVNEFRPRLCVEDFGYVAQYLDDEEVEPECGIPMVSFCDIPLSQVTTHMGRYGHYGIGLTKKWGRENGVSPVMYVHENAPGPRSVARLIQLIGSEPLQGQPVAVRALALQPGQVLYHLKPYNGTLIRRDRTEQDVCFYDEREWRYVPANVEEIPSISREQLADPVRCKPVVDLVDGLPSLSFDPWDINYIIVSREAELLPLFYAIDAIKEKYDDDVKNLLKTKLICAERIMKDF
jgi:Putative abortive phage resistance protein AbiGi, antitoxin